MILRRVAMVAVGLAMATSIGLAGLTTATAATPKTLNLTTGPWTLTVNGRGCEVLTFHLREGTFVADDFGDAGVWSGGRSSIGLSWTAGPDVGLLFSGSYVSSSMSYKGSFGGWGFGLEGKLVEGAKAGC
jgi:hypothetical protein